MGVRNKKREELRRLNSKTRNYPFCKRSRSSKVEGHEKAGAQKIFTNNAVFKGGLNVTYCGKGSYDG